MSNTSGEKLLPCPFCGGTPKTWWDWKPIESPEYWEGYNIQCCVCHVQQINKEESIDVWNNRSDNGLYHIEEALKRVRKIHKPKFKHFCHEWDGLEIDEFCPEFNACICFK